MAVCLRAAMPASVPYPPSFRSIFRSEALERTYAATPDPKWVIAAGECAANGGLFAGSYACVGAVSAVIPVDLHIPGCPPTPTQLLQGLLALLESAKGLTRAGKDRTREARLPAISSRA